MFAQTTAATTIIRHVSCAIETTGPIYLVQLRVGTIDDTLPVFAFSTDNGVTMYAVNTQTYLVAHGNLAVLVSAVISSGVVKSLACIVAGDTQ